MNGRLRFAAWLLMGAGCFAAGYAAASANGEGDPPNQFGMPKSVVHISLIKWKEGASEVDKKNAIGGVKKMAGQIPGIKNIWLKPLRMQPRDFHAAFVIEFKDQESAKLYAEHPAHEAWLKWYLPIRETSISPQVTNVW